MCYIVHLDNRKLTILQTIIEAYIRTGEPIGSKLLADMLDVKVSSATVRNEMASLFDMGLLEQPHTSAGRIPSHLGYRIYIDKLMRCNELGQSEKNEIDALFNVKNPDPDKLLEDGADALANFTGCATFSTTITPKAILVKRIEVIAVASNNILIIVIASNGMIKTKTSRVAFQTTNKICDFFTSFANNSLGGKSFHEITVAYMQSIVNNLDEYSGFITVILSDIYELCKLISEGQIYVTGQNNLLSYKEFELGAYDLLNIMNNKQEMQKLICESEQTTVCIGKENANQTLINSTVLITKYKIGQTVMGAIGIVGPVRMDYAKRIPHIEYFAKSIGRILTEILQEK